MTMTSSKLKSLVFSDVHLYHDKTKTEHITNNLVRALPDNGTLSDVDIIFISGDLFDHSVAMSNKNLYFVVNFIYHLLRMCVKYDIVLRVLEGTPSHDWKQSKLIIDINDNLPVPCDVKHVTVLSIEHIDKFGIDVLYVPDEWGTGCADTFNEVKVLLAERNIEKVHLSIMHGCFNYQFPVNLVGKPDVHDERSYLDITIFLIIIGHYHTPSIFERIYVPGSFDRLKHGEEEAKGHLEFTIHDTGAYDVKFIENKRSMIYKTLDFSKLDMSEVVSRLRDYLGASTDECFIRVLANKEDVVYGAMSDLKRAFPNVNFSISLKDKAKDKMVSESKEIKRPSSLTSLNILELMQARLIDKHPGMAQDCINILRGVMDGEQ